MAGANRNERERLPAVRKGSVGARSGAGRPVRSAPRRSSGRPRARSMRRPRRTRATRRSRSSPAVKVNATPPPSPKPAAPGLTPAAASLKPAAPGLTPAAPSLKPAAPGLTPGLTASAKSLRSTMVGTAVAPGGLPFGGAPALSPPLPALSPPLPRRPLGRPPQPPRSRRGARPGHPAPAPVLRTPAPPARRPRRAGRRAAAGSAGTRFCDGQAAGRRLRVRADARAAAQRGRLRDGPICSPTPTGGADARA